MVALIGQGEVRSGPHGEPYVPFVILGLQGKVWFVSLCALGLGLAAVLLKCVDSVWLVCSQTASGGS